MDEILWYRYENSMETSQQYLGGTSHMLVLTFVCVDGCLRCHLCQESVLANSLISEAVKRILCCGIQPSVAALLYGIFFQYSSKLDPILLYF